MSGALTENAITLIITAGAAQDNFTPPTFGPNNANTLTLEGYQVSVSISIAPPGMVSAEISISNLDEKTMNELTTYAPYFYGFTKNTVTILAGDNVSGMSQIFVGNIATAFANFAAMPDPQFNITAILGLDASLNPVPPTSFSGPVNVATVMQQLANVVGAKFENNGVTTVISNPYLPFSAWDQIKALAKAANINWVYDNGTLAIWPLNGQRASAVPLVSPDTGLVGYPSFTQFGVNFRTRFNSAITFGGLVQIQSSLQAACGQRRVYVMDYSLETQVPDGDWFQDVQTTNLNGLAFGQ